MVKLDKANVHIRVDGEDLEEYKVEESYHGCMKCYVPSEAGKVFHYASLFGWTTAEAVETEVRNSHKR